jgi:hypothetical protein
MVAPENDDLLSTWSARERLSLVKAALLVVEAKGDGAMAHAQQRAGLLRQQGDAAGAEAWLRVVAVIAEMQDAAEAE